MRRLILLILCLGLAAPVSAQTLQQGAVLTASATAVTIANTVTAAPLWTSTVPAMTFQNFTPSQRGATALHLRLLGTISTSTFGYAIAPINVGCNFGGTTASIALVNGVNLTDSLSAAPLILDLWVRAQGTAPLVVGRLEIIGASVSSTNGAPAFSAASVVGTTSLRAAQTLACTWQWASAVATNTVTINHGLLTVGN